MINNSEIINLQQIMNYSQIINDFEEIIQIYNYVGSLAPILLKKYNYPELMKNLIVEDHKIVMKIIIFYYKDIDIRTNNGHTYEEIINNLEFVTNNSSPKKEKYIRFNLIIKSWLNSINFFSETIEGSNVNIITDEEIIEYKHLNNNKKIIHEFRINQIDAFEKLEKYGLKTGIHCQATGCGKTYIIIRYIDYVLRNFENPRIILFTERINILADLFDFVDKKCIGNKNKILEWLNNGIGDLRNLDIINRVTNKTKDWNTLLANATKPTLLVINRAFLTKGDPYKSFKKNDINLILHDECHNTSSIQCYKFLKFAKSIDIPIVGFSATPLRTGKNDLEKLLKIYAEPDDEKNLNLLTDYNMIFAITNKLIVPPEFHWFQLGSFKSRKNKELVTQEELGAVLEMLNLVVLKMKNKKIVAWCGTIELAKEWKRLFELNYKQRVNLKDLEFGIDTSVSDTGDYKKFKNINGNMILFCAQKHREGSDIQRLDACIFLDKVCNRGAIPFIQSIGRVLRLCIFTDKIYGIIIDGYLKENNNYAKVIIDKIFDYYFALQNITSDFNSENKYDTYVKFKDVIKLNPEKEEIALIINGITININCHRLEWKNIEEKYSGILQQKLKISKDEYFNIIINKLKEMEPFQNCENNFWDEYSKLDHKELHFPVNILEEYSEFFNTKTWYDLLELKKYLTLDNFRIQFYKDYPKIKSINEKSYHKIKKNINIPNYPFEYYRLENINTYEDIIN